MTRVSVVLPTRDRADYVERAIASALAQTVADLEVIVVDDASTDETPSVLRALAGSEPRVRVLRHEEPRGAPAARNAGIDAAAGAVVAFLDDDCVWHPDKLAKQLGAMGPGRGVAYCDHAIRHGEEWIVEGEPGAARDGAGALLRRNYIGTPSMVVRCDLLEAVDGFDETLPRLQDWDLVLRLGRKTGFAYVPELLVRGDQMPVGITMDRAALPAAAERMVERHGPHLARRERAALHYGLAKYLLVDGLTDPARRYFMRALRLDPLAPAHWAGIAAALTGPRPARWLRSVRRRRRAGRHEIDGIGAP
ncbi:MAG: glycosyltransferase family A protein [Longimicrobiales bacterium]|nr:glycosyltransferase family A protein [Longimicrobiales bacterium]